MDKTSNPYCDRLGIAVPRVEDGVGRRGMNLHGLMVIALLERGGPMTLGEIADRLERADAPCKSGDMALSVVPSMAREATVDRAPAGPRARWPRGGAGGSAGDPCRENLGGYRDG